jgi:hypothetical protein
MNYTTLKLQLHYATLQLQVITPIATTTPTTTTITTTATTTTLHAKLHLQLHYTTGTTATAAITSHYTTLGFNYTTLRYIRPHGTTTTIATATTIR